MALIEGKTVRSGGREFVVPPLNIKLSRKYKEQLSVLASAEEIKKLKSPDYVELTIPLVIDNLKRNYPELTQDEFEEAVSTSDLPGFVTAMFSTSKLKDPKEVQEDQGDPKPEAPSGMSTGTGSAAI